jgi:hypothetical protein
VLNVRKHVSVNVAQAYYKVSITIIGSVLLMLNYDGEREVIDPWLFYINAAVTVNAYSVTPFYRLISVRRDIV